MTEVQQAKARLLEWANQTDSSPSVLTSAVGPALAAAATGLIVGRLLPGSGKRRTGVVSSLVGNAFSLATIVPIAKAVLPVLLKKL